MIHLTRQEQLVLCLLIGHAVDRLGCQDVSDVPIRPGRGGPESAQTIIKCKQCHLEEVLENILGKVIHPRIHSGRVFLFVREALGSYPEIRGQGNYRNN